LPNREGRPGPLEPIADPGLDALIAADQLRQLFSKSVAPYVGPAICSVLYASVVWKMVPHGRLWAWMGAMFSIMVVRLFVRGLYRRVKPGIAATRRWERTSMLVSAFHGATWGIGFFWIYTPGSIGAQMLYALICCGLAAGATGLNASHVRSYVAFTTPLAVPLAIRFFLHPDWIHRVMAILVIVWVVTMVSVVATTNRITREAARLRFRLASANTTLARRAQQLGQFASRLRRAEERVRIMMEAINVGIWYSDYPFDKVHISRGIRQRMGLPEAEVPTEVFLSTSHPEDREMVRRAVARCIERGEDYDVESRTVPLRDGCVHWVRNVGRCFRDADGRPHHFDGIVYDITKKKAEEAERERLLRDLSEANLLRDRLLGIVGHDLRTPIGAVTMSAQLLQRHTLDEKAKQSVDRILRSASRMKRLIGQLLDLARIRATGGIPVETTPVDLHALFRHVIDEVAGADPKIAISLEVSGDGRGTWDGDRLAQVFSNLLANAIQHGADAGPVSVRVIDEGENVAITVHNQGTPIPADVLPFIFDPFRQGEEHGKTPSASVGLGLYIVQQIILAHDGWVDVRSPDGDGTTFTIHLPRHPSVRQPSGSMEPRSLLY
jgi:PAS domain S-box-containing protein